MANITNKKRDELDRAINAKAIKAWVKRYSVKDASRSGIGDYLAHTEWLWQLGDVVRYASSFVKTRRVGDSSTARIGITVHIRDALPVGINDLEARAYGLNGPRCWEAASICAVQVMQSSLVLSPSRWLASTP